MGEEARPVLRVVVGALGRLGADDLVPAVAGQNLEPVLLAREVAGHPLQNARGLAVAHFLQLIIASARAGSLVLRDSVGDDFGRYFLTLALARLPLLSSGLWVPAWDRASPARLSVVASTPSSAWGGSDVLGSSARLGASRRRSSGSRGRSSPPSAWTTSPRAAGGDRPRRRPREALRRGRTRRASSYAVPLERPRSTRSMSSPCRTASVGRPPKSGAQKKRNRIGAPPSAGSRSA